MSKLRKGDMRGEKHPRAKLRESDVRRMRADRARDRFKFPLRVLAERHGVSTFTVWAICNRERWRHVE